MIRDLVVGPEALVYGLGDGPTFFVFDAGARKLAHRATITQYGNVAGGQAQRSMLIGPDRAIYAYFQKAIVRIHPRTFQHEAVAEPPVDIQIGIALVHGRFYFAHGSHLYSCEVSAMK